jgi:peptide/nickel transport system substrate-binding protein
MQNRRDTLRSALGAGALALPALSAACAPGGGGGEARAKATTGGSVTFVLENDVINFDPLLSRAFVDRNVLYQVFDSLVRIDASGKIIPWLAEKWETSADGKAVTFSLRKDVKYQDGSPFDGESVKWNSDRYRTAEGSFRRGELAPVDGVEVINPSTVRFILRTPFSPLLSLLVDRAGMMLSRAAVEAGGADFTRKPSRAGTGPFIITEAVKDDHVTLERNPEWWGRDREGNRLPYLDKIVVKPITDSDVRLTNVKTGNAHVANSVSLKDVAGLKAEGSLDYQEKPGLSWGSLIPNRRAGFVFNEVRYVKALAMAIDRKELLDRWAFGVGSVGYGAIAPPHAAFDPTFKPFERPNPDGARRLVAEVGKGPLSFEFLIAAGDPQTLQLALLIQAQYKKADINAEIKQLEFAQILQLQADRTFPGVAFTAWSGRIDPDGNASDFVVTGRPSNDSSYSNKDVDRLMEEQRATTDEAKRRDLLRQAERIYVVEDPARIWYRFGVAHLASVKKLKGLEPYPDQLIRFQDAWLQK